MIGADELQAAKAIAGLTAMAGDADDWLAANRIDAEAFVAAVEEFAKVAGGYSTQAVVAVGFQLGWICRDLSFDA